MISLRFDEFCDRYKGQCARVIGRGPTRYEYENLALADGPSFFLNDAVSAAVHSRSHHDSFFFAHDRAMQVWLPRIPVIAVLASQHPISSRRDSNQNLANGPDDPIFQAADRVVTYQCVTSNQDEGLLTYSREEIAARGELHGHSGTIHSALHFIWYTGCSRVQLIGCDGIPSRTYDQRLENRSDSMPSGVFRIRMHQDSLLAILKLPGDYVGTPAHTIICDVSIGDNMPAHAGLIGELISFAQRSIGCFGATVYQRDACATSVRTVWYSVDALSAFLRRRDINRLLAKLHKRGTRHFNQQSSVTATIWQ